MSDVVSPVLVGRDTEVAWLRAAVSRAAQGQPGLVVVSGEAGVGKSRLIEAALEAETGVRVLTGGCIELGGEGLPFVPLVEALRDLVRGTPPDHLDALLGPARPELARLLPELAPPDSAPAVGSGSTAQLFELVLGVLGRLAAERPLVLVIEDLHWADRSTLDLVAFLARALRGLRLLLVTTYRSDEVDRRSPLRPLLTSWERQREIERLQLERLGRMEVSEQIQAILGTRPDPALVDVVFTRSEGNPFFVEELLRTLREGRSGTALPPSLRDVLLARAERLSGPARRLLRTAAVAGRWVPERLLAEVAEVPAAELYEALREAVDASLLVVDDAGRGYAFRHALTRDTVYQDLLPGERVDLHTAYARALDRDPTLAGEDASVWATLAVHWYAAHDLPRALAASVRAGREAIAAFAPAEAGRHLERALEVWRSVPDAEERAGTDQVEVLRLAARATFQGGEPERALSLFQQALDQLGHESDPERAALIVEQRAYALRVLGEDGASITALEEALTWLPAEPVTPARATVLASLAHGFMRLGHDRAEEIAQTALDAARATGARAEEASALITLGGARSYEGDGSGGEEALRSGLALALEIGDHDTALRGYVNLSDHLEAHGRYRAAADTAREGLELAGRAGQYRSVGAYLTGNLVEPLVRLGDWAEAERLANEDLAAGLSGVFAASLHEVLGYVATCRGRGGEALEHLGQARGHLRSSREPQFAHALAYIEADVARARGDLDTAAELAADELRETSTWAMRYAWPLVWLGARIEAERAIRARDRGEPVPERIVTGPPARLSDPAGDLSPAVAGYRVMTAAEHRRRDGTADVEAWQRALAAWQTAGEAWPLAYASYRLGEALCLAGRRDEAASSLRTAVEQARRLGAGPLEDDVLALARRARISLDPASGTAEPAEAALPFGLTEREREVLALVTVGRSNSQIAKELFISPKTASVHVSNILGKLGVAGRVEAAAVAHRLGLVGSRAENGIPG